MRKTKLTDILGLIVGWTLPTGLIFSNNLLVAYAQPSPSFHVIVNSNLDGDIKADANLTLREAIDIINGNLLVSQLSSIEKAQIVSLVDNENTPNLITFNLPTNLTTIKLLQELPPLQKPAIIDGTTQPGYQENIDQFSMVGSKICQNQAKNLMAKIPQPVVTLTPANGVEVLRGLTIISGDVTVRGLSFFGFNSRYQNRETAVASVLPANILITNQLPPKSINEISPQSLNKPLQIPRNVLIEKNQFGLSPSLGAGIPVTPVQKSLVSNTKPALSAFGILIFNSQGTTIRQNQIANHTGSGIITGILAENTQIVENIIENNGFTGMPNAIHFEGQINNSQISDNLICQNAGSGIFFFKTQGATQIIKNNIFMNGRGKKTAAIYLMGVGHQIRENKISQQNGPGVAVAAYPQSYRNQITSNSFSSLDGLSIDLTTQLNESVAAYLIGDGPNPIRNSYYRREETGNNATKPPQFLAREFLILGDKVNIDGKADPGTTIEIYRVLFSENLKSNYGPLTEKIASTETDKEGRFGISLTTLKAGDIISAIATNSEFGTSEPAQNATIIK